MIDKSEREQFAIGYARRFFAEELNRRGLMGPFFDRTKEDINALVEACVDGFREGLWKVDEDDPRKPLDDEIPF